MATHSDIKPLSDRIAAPILKTYQAACLGLVLILTGTMLLLTAVFLATSVFRYLLAAVGTLNILFALRHFYWHDMRKLEQANASMESSGHLINTIQRAAIDMTDLAGSLQALAFEHADEVTFLIKTFRERLRSVNSIPFVSSMPGINKLTGFADDPYVMNVESLSASIVRTTADVRRAIDALQSALRLSDATRLETCLADLQELNCQTKTLVPDHFRLVRQRQTGALRPPTTDGEP